MENGDGSSLSRDGRITNVIKFEQLDAVVLVGHSFGGVPITGVVDRMPEKVRHLIYLDSLILQDGQTAFSQLAPDVVADRIKAADGPGRERRATNLHHLHGADIYATCKNGANESRRKAG